MDKKNKELLGYLLENSRLGITALAKKLKLRKETVHYRLKKLKEQYIHQYYTIINYSAIGFKRYVCFMQLKKISLEEEAKFLEFLKQHLFVTYMGPLIGKWNVVFDILVRDEDQLQKVVDEITSKIKPFIESYIVNGSNIKEEVYHTKFFPTTTKIIEKQPKNKTLVVLDKIDKKLLFLLTKNARITYAELSQKLGLTGNGIKKRIIRLKKKKIISGYTISLDFHKLGFELYVLQIKLMTLNDNSIIEYLRQHPQVFFTYKYLGQQNWDIDIGLFVKSNKDIRLFLVELKKLFGESIKLHDMYIVADIIKDNIAPDGLFK